MRVERHTAIAPIAAEWDALGETTGASLFDRPAWLDAWWRAFGSGELEIVAVREGDELAAVLPLARRAGGFRSPTNWHTPSFSPTGTAAGIAAAYDAVLASAPAYVNLRFLPRPDALTAAAERHPYVAVSRVLERSPYVLLNGDDGKRATAPPGSGKRVRRLERMGEVELDVRGAGGDLEGDLRLAFELEGSGWKLAERTAIVSRGDTLRFYTEVARWAAGAGILRLFFLLVGGRAIAAEIVLAAGGSTYNLKGGYHPDFRRYSPGLVLRDLMIMWAQEQGYRTHEFLGTVEPWKLEWTDLLRERHEVMAVRGRIRGGAARLALVHGRPLAQRLRAAIAAGRERQLG